MVLVVLELNRKHSREPHLQCDWHGSLTAVAGVKWRDTQVQPRIAMKVRAQTAARAEGKKNVSTYTALPTGIAPVQLATRSRLFAHICTFPALN